MRRRGDGTASPAPPPANRAPEPAGAIPDLTVHMGETATIDAWARFTDPDGDAPGSLEVLFSRGIPDAAAWRP
ncbi:MAG: hypothetical protein OXI46_07285 [Gemmatimonadota bacterium]|nr:hypothetical protein [Gemmatimonadota bacterium]